MYSRNYSKNSPQFFISSSSYIWFVDFFSSFLFRFYQRSSIWEMVCNAHVCCCVWGLDVSAWWVTVTVTETEEDSLRSLEFRACTNTKTLLVGLRGWMDGWVSVALARVWFVYHLGLGIWSSYKNYLKYVNVKKCIFTCFLFFVFLFLFFISRLSCNCLFLRCVLLFVVLVVLFLIICNIIYNNYE